MTSALSTLLRLLYSADAAIRAFASLSFINPVANDAKAGVMIPSASASSLLEVLTGVCAAVTVLKLVACEVRRLSR